MGFFLKFSFLVFAVVIAAISFQIHNLLKVPPVPTLRDTWWGPGREGKDDTAIKPFKINVAQEVLDDLKVRLSRPRAFVPTLEGVKQQYGMNTGLLTNIVDFWKTKYNWRDREVFLNQYPQFTTQIQGLKIHFIRVKPSTTAGVQVVPLLLLHGWPGSVREFYEIIPMLTKPQKGRNFVFELIIPSLPGYGFSEGASKPGLGAVEMGVIFKNLMQRLGFEKYYIQGGDWGAAIVTTMATLYPEKILGMHSNMCLTNTAKSMFKTFLGSFCPSLVVDEKYASRMYPYGKVFSYLMLESGYMHIQATKPDTVGVGLNDSPVGLAAYLLEKFTTWTNPEWKTKPDGGLQEKFTYTNLLDNVMIYWVTGSITTSMRLYYESFSMVQTELALDNIPTPVPAACARFRHELLYQSDYILKDKYTNLVQTSDFEVGGHFIAFEEPQLLANDIWSAVEKFRSIKK